MITKIESISKVILISYTMKSESELNKYEIVREVIRNLGRRADFESKKDYERFEKNRKRWMKRLKMIFYDSKKFQV